MTLGELASRCGGVLERGSPETAFTGFALDNREVNPGDVFIAIEGARVDGHDFVESATQAGAVCALVSRPVPGTSVLVSNIVEAIAALGSSLRGEFGGPVIGITGSNGKTSAKEFLAAVLSASGPVLKSEGNRNTELTSPLLWHDRAPEHWAAVVEMSMRGAGQIKHLCKVHRPTHALITNIGLAHIELLGCQEAIANAKGELLESIPGPTVSQHEEPLPPEGRGAGERGFEGHEPSVFAPMANEGVAILWAEDRFLDHLKTKTAAAIKTYGFSSGADAQVVSYEAHSIHECEIVVQVAGKTVRATLPTVGRHQALNAAGALLMAAELGVDPQQAAERLKDAKLPAMRMEHRQHNGADILMDNYNASPDSMKVALRTLMELPCKGRRIAVIGEMRELGAHAEEAHRELGGALVLEEPDMILLYGPLTRPSAEVLFEAGYPAPNLCLATSMDDVRAFLGRVQPGDLVLVKGSRALGMEEALAP